MTIDGPSVDWTRELLHLDAGRPTTVQCVVISGLPAPNVELFVGRQLSNNITGQFDLVRRLRPAAKIADEDEETAGLRGRHTDGDSLSEGYG